MGYFREVDPGPSFATFAGFREHLGFIPNLFRAQTLLPRVIEAETRLLAAVFLKGQALSRVQKGYILLVIAAAHQNTYCVTVLYQMLRLLGVPERQLDRIISDYRKADLSTADTTLLDLALKLGKHGPPVSREDVTGPFSLGLTDECMLEAILITGLANFLCTLSTGLGAAPDFAPQQIPTTGPAPSPAVHSDRTGEESSGPYLKAVERIPDEFAPFAFFREKYGFIPNIFRAQTLRPDVLEAEAGMIGAVLLTEDLLTRVQKECILLVTSAANLNTYCVAVRSEMLRGLGVCTEDSDQIAVDHRQSRLPEAHKALLDYTLKLAARPAEFCREDMLPLGQHGFSEEQILEAVVMTSLTTFLNTLQMGLGTIPDFPPQRVFRPAPKNKVHLSEPYTRPTSEGLPSDPDAELVARVQRGDLDAFEDLMNLHSQRVYRTLVGILGDPDEARDALQDTFLTRISVFERLLITF